MIVQLHFTQHCPFGVPWFYAQTRSTVPEEGPCNPLEFIHVAKVYMYMRLGTYVQFGSNQIRNPKPNYLSLSCLRNPKLELLLNQLNINSF
jgi:hypothetical protein